MSRNNPIHRKLPAFTAESTLGRLTKWLRLAGFDVLLDHTTPDAVRLVRLSGRDNRIILTRTRQIAKRLGSKRAIFIRHNRHEDQLRQVMRQLDIAYGDLRPLTICAHCNQPLNDAEKSGIKQRVPEHVWHHQAVFRECRRCRRVYWPGTHAHHIKQTMRRWFSD